MRDIKELIEICTEFAVKKGLCYGADRELIRNKLLTLFGVDSPFDGAINDVPSSLVPTLEEMCDYAAEHGMLEMNTPTYRAMFDNKICGCLIMMQSQVQEKFAALYKESPMSATEWFYAFCEDSNYIRTYDVAKNIKYDYKSSYGNLEITINLTKPEKDPKEIEKQKSMPQTGYPRCMLCLENVGYPGRLGYPSHETLRTVPVTLDGEKWNFQYSPYVYYNEHCIAFCNRHTPMTMDEKKFVRLFDFLKQFPHYFIGSNTQLPVVGGSILTHEHFQGGRHIMPMEKASPLYYFDCGNDKVKACVVNWPMTCLRFTAASPDDIIPIASNVLKTWQGYSDDTLGIYAYTDGKEHNTVTPIVRKTADGMFECDIVLRNNITTADLPLGVFHPHPDKHNIKKENIGLIEVMGLFILPGRLKKELDALADAWVYNKDIDCSSVHCNWYQSFRNTYKPKDFDDAKTKIYSLVGGVCENVLRDAGVYKEDTAGREGLKRFISACGYKA